MSKWPLFSFDGFVYRFHEPRWSFAPESGAGAAKHGGRFNPQGVEALYTSLDPVTALNEASRGLANVQPSLLCQYRVNCSDLLDLSTPQRCASLGIDFSILSSGWRWYLINGKTPPSWVLSTRLINEGVAGIKVPSFASGSDRSCLNLVFWRWSRHEPHQVSVVDDANRLPRNGDSWGY